MKETSLKAGDVEQLATGFGFVEGPVWHQDGYWLFSDIPSNRIHKFSPEGDVEIYREPSGNSNGLTINRAGRLLACEHGNRRFLFPTSAAPKRFWPTRTKASD